MTTQLIGSHLDYIVVVLYFVIVLGFGLYFGRYTASTKDFFFGGQRFSWWLISFSCVATVVGSYSFIKYSAAGFRYGICSTQSYLNDWFWLPITVLLWIPIIYYRKIITIPEYMQHRFDRKTRIAATFIILLYLVGYIGINLVTLGRTLHTLMGWEIMTGATVTAIAVGAYVYAGGQTAVIMTDLIQGVILLMAGLGLFFAGVYHLGGFGEFWALLPTSHKFIFSEFNAPPEFSFVGIFAQDGLANTGAFMLMNQGIIMRFMSLKSVQEARKMTFFWILVLAPLAALAVSGAGWVAKAMVVKGELNTEAGDSFIKVAHFLCRPGVFGFVLAALIAALMSTADTLINAVSAIFVNDVYHPYLKPGADDQQCLKVAKISSLVAAGLGLALVPIFARDTLYGAHAMFTAAVTPPIVMVILMGVLWRRYNHTAAFATMVGGSALVFLSFKWDHALIGPLDFGMGAGSYKFMRALFGLIASGVIGVAVTFLTRAQPLSRIAGLVAGTQVEAMRQFKGGEPNRRIGKKAGLMVKIDVALSEADIALVPRAALDKMAAESGDLLYACHSSWWYGGLRSVHLKAGGLAAEEGVLHISPAAASSANFSEGQQILLEKII
ncbi:MAG: sodium:solute symporter family protein [Kiritimatiellae bacterium]|nr:sodium:solute symporter family protein [Kiritimatiellia bacterium]